MDYDTRHDARQRLIAYAAIGIMVGALIVSVTHTRRANARADAATTAVNSWVYTSAQRNQEIEALLAERDYLAERLVEALSESPTSNPIDGFQTKAELLYQLREIAESPDVGLLHYVGYEGNDGDFHGLKESDLGSCPRAVPVFSRDTQFVGRAQ